QLWTPALKSKARVRRPIEVGVHGARGRRLLGGGGCCAPGRLSQRCDRPRGRRGASQQTAAHQRRETTHQARPILPIPRAVRWRAREAPPGFEPGNEGFADPCLTTWPWRQGVNKFLY